jgi:hypothetical protein
MDDIFGQERHEQLYIPLDKIIPNSWNANEQDEVMFDGLVSDVADTGFIDSLTVVPAPDGFYRIIGGEHRWMAAKAAGEETVPCLVLVGEKWQDMDLQKFVTVRMNMRKGKLNPQKFIKLYDEMAEKYGQQELQKLFGFTNKHALNKVIKDATKSAKKVLPKELHGELEEKAKDAKTVEDIGRIVQEMFAKSGDTVAQSYMIFTYGKQEHIYVSMSNTMRKAMDKVLLFCDTSKIDINDFMAPIIKAHLTEAMKGLDAVEEKDEDSENAYD